MNLLTFNDFYKILPPGEDFIQSWNDSFIPDGHRRGLNIKLRASHAGIYNDNLRFYLPSAMEDGVLTFTTKRNKPAKILKHHDAMSDPVGIITGASFTWTIPDELKSDKDVMIMCDSSFPDKKKIAAAKRFMQSGYPFKENWEGLGRIDLDATILDEKAIDQIKTGLFDAVSTSFGPGKGGVYCSECGQNLRDGMCDHEPGKIYEDEDGNKAPCAFIPVKHEYKECSLVVFDADPLTAISISEDSSKNTKVYTLQNSTIQEDASTEYEFKDFKEDVMAKPTKPLSDTEQKVSAIIKKFRPEIEEDKLTSLTQEVCLLEKDGKLHPDQEVAGLDDETVVLYALDEIENKGKEIDADAVYEEMAKELEEDAKLSAEKRKGLSSSTFCGPNRSFPVPDCSHVTAARRLIGRYKGPGDKTSILACVARKAKALGCGDGKGDSVETDTPDATKMEMPTCDMLTTLDNDQVRSLFHMAESEMITRQMTVARECSKCAEADDRAKAAVEDKKLIETKLEDLEQQLKYLRVELRDQYNEYSLLVDQNVELRSQILGEKSDKLAVIGVLSGKFSTIEDAKTELSTNLEATEAVINDGFDLVAITKKLNDGMDHTPNGNPVANPAFEDDKQSQTIFDSLGPHQKKIFEQIKKFMTDGEETKAKQLYSKMVGLKVLDSKQIPFNTFSAKDNPAE